MPSAKLIAAGGSTIRDYTDPMAAAGGYQRAHRVYGRAGLGCVRCGAVLTKTIAAQRTTVYCPGCQPRCQHERNPIKGAGCG